MCLYDSQTICGCAHAEEIKSTNKDDKVLSKEAFHDVEIGVLAGVDFAYPVVGGFEELLAAEVDNLTHYMMIS